MVKDYWNPIKLFRCLAVKGKNYTKLHNKTLGGRIAKKGTRPIPEGFLDRFLERYAEVDPALVPVKEAVREYYTKRLTDGDYDFDSERTIYPELFEEQLGAVQDTSLVPSKYIRDISHDRQWRVVRIVNKGAFGMVYLLEWYPFKNMVYGLSCVYGLRTRSFILTFYLGYCRIPLNLRSKRPASTSSGEIIALKANSLVDLT